MSDDLNRIIFYDGECGLCQRSIRFVYRFDKKKIIKFAPLQGNTYKKITASNVVVLDTVRYFKDDKFYLKSSALFEICKDLGGGFYFFLVLKIIPSCFLDKIYNLVATNRKKISCVYIKKDERFYE